MAVSGSEEDRELARLLFEARELIDMLSAIVQAVDPWSRRVRDALDEYRIERGWSSNGDE